MKKQTAIALIAVLGLSAVRTNAQVPKRKTLECEVLEVSDRYRGDRKELAAIGYLIIRHKNPGDRKALSEWLRRESGASVTFRTPDGVQHRGVLRRLRMCFGRGLLIFVGPLALQERESIIVEF